MNKKDFIIGFLIASLTFAIPVKAIEVAFQEVTLRDLFAGFALCGLLSKPLTLTEEEKTKTAFLYADLMMKNRKR